MSSPSLPVTDRSRLRRRPARGCHDPATVHAIIDAAPICHVALTGADGLMVLPTAHVRIGDAIFLHGAPASNIGRMVEAPVTMAFTIVDGLVLARSGMHHSMNYRSVIVFGHGRPVASLGDRRTILDALIERMMPGRTAEIRPATEAELAATAVIAVSITEASAKIRSGGPLDDPADLAAHCWAGVVPVRTVLGAPEPAVDLHVGLDGLRSFSPTWVSDHVDQPGSNAILDRGPADRHLRGSARVSTQRLP